MICKIIEDDYTFEQIESIEAIFELEKKYNLNISIEDKSYPELYPEIGLQTSYKVYKNDKKTIDLESLHLRDIKLSKDNYGVIKHLKKFNIQKHITPLESSKNFVELVYEMPLEML